VHSKTGRQITAIAVLCVSYLLTGHACAAQSFRGDLLEGEASGTFDTWGIAAGDFNGDGKLDIATVSLNENTLNVFLGNGAGTFGGGFTYTFAGEPNSPISVIAADVNGDGKLDLIVACYNTLNVTGGGTVTVFLGNGDGTFSHNADYAVRNHPTAVVAADFNGDGAVDLAATVNDAGAVAILLNNGDGTFQASVSYSASNGPYSLAVGDFNGDGNSDLVLTNYCNLSLKGGGPSGCNASNAFYGTVSVLLGNGDGTFRAAVSYQAGTAPYGIATAALSSGGNTDILVTDNSDGSLLVLPGKGDGTFLSPVSYPSDGGSYILGDQGSFLTVADFNGDGNLDVITSGVSLVEFLGNGDGTLQQAVDYYRSTPGYPYFHQAAGDFNGDGNLDIAVGFNQVFSVFLNAAGTTRQVTTTTVQTAYNGCGSETVNARVTSGSQVPTGTLTLQVDGLYSTSAQFGTLDSSGKASATVTLTAGTPTITVFYSGDSLTQGSVTTSSVSIQPQASSTRLDSSPNPSITGQPVTFTAYVTPSGSSASCLSGPVTFLDGTTTLGTVQLGSLILSSEAALTSSALTAGSHSITASYGGSEYISPSVSPIVIQVVSLTPDYNLSVTPATLTIVAGQSGTAKFTVTPMNGLNSAVTFACGDLPSGATCSFNPSSVTPSGGNAVSSTLTVGTTAASASLPARNRSSHFLNYALIVPLFGVIFGIAPRRRSAIGGLRFFGIITLLALAMGPTSCGGHAANPPNTTEVKSTVTVTASTTGSGSTNHTASLTITITQ